MSFSTLLGDWLDGGQKESVGGSGSGGDKLSQNQRMAQQQAGSGSGGGKRDFSSSQGDGGAQMAKPPEFEFDRYFLSWLTEVKHSFVISSYKTHKVFSLGLYQGPPIGGGGGGGGGPKLSMWISHFNRPMGIHADKSTIWVGTSGNLWRFENAGEWKSVGENQGVFDANYVPRFGYFSSDIDTHDICLDSEGKPYYISAMFGCVCEPSDTHTFKVYWKPPWLSKISPEDRTHLNGICSRDGKPRYVSAACKGDIKGAWREKRIGHGVVWDIVENRAICEGLSMPHSPRWHNGKLWVLEAGTGNFGYIEGDWDKKDGTGDEDGNGKSVGAFKKCVFIPGYLRGLGFVGDRYAIIGSSQDRYESCFQGLPLGDELKKHGVESKCGMFVVDLKNFDIVHSLTFKSPIDELYDICVIPNVIRPKLQDLGDDKNMREYLIDYGDFPNPS